MVKNREIYCKKHGYTLLNGNELIDNDRPIAWSKLVAAEYHLAHTFDYVFYVDMDAVIMNMVIYVAPTNSFRLASFKFPHHLSPSPSASTSTFLIPTRSSPQTGHEDRKSYSGL